MRKLAFIISIFTLAVINYSCEKDNYKAPDATITGKILDHNGKLLQTEQGSGNMRIKMEELSWNGGAEGTVVTPQYLNVRQDGTYINTKWFPGKYRMTPIEGAFYPYNTEGELVDISKSVTKDFTVIPYLDVEWITEPHMTSDGYIEASVKFARNSKEGVAKPDLNNLLFCIATTQYVGNNNYDSQLISGTMKITNDMEGTVINVKTSKPVKYAGATYYVRVGICCSDAYKKYNYTDIKIVKNP